MLFPRLSFAPLLFFYTVLGCLSQFCLTNEEKDVVGAILKKIPPLPWPQILQSFLTEVNGDAHMGKLTELQKQYPLLGDENFHGGYVELALRNLPLYKDYGHMKDDSDWERRLLLRIMLYRRPIHFQTEHSKFAGTFNTFESYLHIGAIELEINLLQSKQYSAALRNVQIRLLTHAALRSSTARNLTSLPIPARFDLFGQSLEVMMLSNYKSDTRLINSNLWYAASLWKHLNGILQSTEKEPWNNALHFLLGQVSFENFGIDRALNERLCRLKRVYSKLPNDLLIIFLDYCNFIARMLPFRNAPLRLRIEEKLRSFNVMFFL